MITQLEPDILGCEVKWALGRITTNKASGGDGIPVGLIIDKSTVHMYIYIFVLIEASISQG